MTLIAATVVTKQTEKLKKRWKLEGGLPPVPGQKTFPEPSAAPPGPPADIPLHWKKENYRLLAPGELGPSMDDKDPEFAGSMVVFDWETRSIIWESQWGNTVLTPCGFSFADGGVYVGDLEGAHVFKVDLRDKPGQVVERISHPSLNDLHSVQRTPRGLLVTCSGTDLVMELDLQGNALWEWWAAENGFDMTPVGKRRISGRGSEQRNQYYHTRFQTTHVNKAVLTGPGDGRVLMTLFHQGIFACIDRARPLAEQRAEVVLSGLARPHGPSRFGDGWLVCNSLGKELVTLDASLKVTSRIDYPGGWIQDCTMLSNGNLLLNDVDNHVIVELGGPSWAEVSRFEYDANWRLGDILQVPNEYVPVFRRGR